MFQVTIGSTSATATLDALTQTALSASISLFLALLAAVVAIRNTSRTLRSQTRIQEEARRALAAGLYAEVRLIQKRIRKTKKKMEKDNITSFIGTFEHRRDIIGQNVVGESTLARHFSEIDTDIYDRNNDKIGALGVDIARKLVFVYSNARRRGYEKICKLNHEQLYYRLRFINSDKDDLDEDIDKLLEMLSIAAGIDRNQENTDQFIDNS